MAKTAKRVLRKSAPKQRVLTSLETVERDMRRTVAREKNIGKLQGQIRRQLARNRVKLAEFVEFLKAEHYIDATRAGDEPALPL